MAFILRCLLNKESGMRMKNNLKKKMSLFNIIIQSLKYSWRASKGIFLLLIITSFVMGGVEILQIMWLQRLFDEITLIVSKGNVEKIIVVSIFLALILLVRPVAELAQFLVQGHFWRRGTCYLQCLFHEKVGKLDLIDFEYSETYDQMRKITEANDYAPSVSRSVIELGLCYIPFFIFTITYIGHIKKILILTMLFMLIPCIVANLIQTKISYDLQNETASLKRKMDGFENCIYSPMYFKETRTINAVVFFIDKLKKTAKDYNSVVLKKEKKVFKWNVFLQAINICGYICSLILLVVFLYRGEISIGAFASIFYSMEKLSSLLETFVGKVGSVVKDGTAASFLIEFFAVLPETKLNEKLSKEDIYLESVSFKYPNVDSMSLNDINLHIKKGETIAIVGENGAGKSTLAKIIIGLYPPVSGCVKYGDKDISLYNNTQKYKDISAVFQDFQKYKLTLDENVKIAAPDIDGDIREVLKSVNIENEKIDYWKDSILAKEYGGVDLSGGEWQHVAMARGVYKPHQIIILDEPTSAIDPIEEYNIFQLFMKMSQDKTALIVTHRIGAAKLADRIVVLDAGKIKEIGTHQELMEQKGLYYTMFLEQASWYSR